MTGSEARPEQDTPWGRSTSPALRPPQELIFHQLRTGNGDPAAGGGSAPKKEKKLKGKWTEEEEKLLIKLRSSGMKWVDISQQNPGRSATACRLRYQNYTEKKEWGEDEKDMLARLYHRGEMQLASDPQRSSTSLYRLDVVSLKPTMFKQFFRCS
ncbi:putative myb dna-binding domain protein [Neofusicoccum parvum UCRNP2]|uniref:Myb DNA-binding domain protein n=2 Tax=Neofusicoccum parvum TaxID=310453 RepID=A0ACB5S2K7_9PEZI|nr:putative myb dna-binding domain protein [Neofusicoccum parvum UCRNP2]GME26991.1 myb DNA-binding domain protein [Neofusicoccum parvum]